MSMQENNIQELLAITLDKDFDKNTALRKLPLPLNNTDIIKLLVEWTELLSLEKYQEALSMFTFDRYKFDWTAQKLEQCVYGYGCTGYSREEAEKMFGSADYIVTSILDNPQKEIIFNEIEIQYFEMTAEQAKATLTNNHHEILGDIHYKNVPLNGELSNLTARFWIRKFDDDLYILEFQDMHMM